MKEEKIRELLKNSKNSFDESWDGSRRLWSRIDGKINEKSSAGVPFLRPVATLMVFALFGVLSWHLYIGELVQSNLKVGNGEITYSDIESIYFGYEENVFLEDSFAHNESDDWESDYYDESSSYYEITL